MVTIEVKVDIITAQVSALTFYLRMCFQPLFQPLRSILQVLSVSQFRGEILIVLV